MPKTTTTLKVYKLVGIEIEFNIPKRVTQDEDTLYDYLFENRDEITIQALKQLGVNPEGISHALDHNDTYWISATDYDVTYEH